MIRFFSHSTLLRIALPHFIPQNHSISQCLQDACQYLTVSDTPRLDAELLLAHVLNKTRVYLYTYPEQLVDASQLIHFSKLLETRQKKFAVARILGVKEFWGLNLHVSAHTLIPRPETEILVEKALDLIQSISHPRILDLGTGSGAIALALASERPDARILAVDSCDNALETAAKNASTLHIKTISFCHSHWFGHVSGEFDLIISNPPYISSNDIWLESDGVCHEPITALVADNEGLADFENISKAASQFMKSGAWLIFEHGHEQGQAIQKMLNEKGFSNLATFHDLAKLPRVTQGQNP